METPPADSLTTRLRAARRSRQHEKILQEKDVEEKVERRKEVARERSVPGEGFFAEAGGLFAFMGRFFARFWRRPFEWKELLTQMDDCLLYTSPSPRDRQKSRMPSSA